MTNPDLIDQLKQLNPTEGEWRIQSNEIQAKNKDLFLLHESTHHDNVLASLAPTMRLEILAMAQEIEELRGQLKSTNRKVKFCSASINGALDGLELDNDCDVIEKSTVIEQLKIQLNFLTPNQK